MNRRTFLTTAVGAGMVVLGSKAGGGAAADGGKPILHLPKALTSPVKIASIDVLKVGGNYFLRTRSAEGTVGVAMANSRVAYLMGILQKRVIPYFIGKDARDIERLIEGVYVHQSNYKLGGLPFWNCAGAVEFSLFDLLGKIAGKSVADLLGGRIRDEIPVYLSSMRRDTTPQQEVAWLSKRLAETGSDAVKLKVGGRMSRNRDAFPGRTDKLIPLARKTFGNRVAMYTDANGSYDAAGGIEVGRMLQGHNVAFFEEPCPWEELEETKRVTDALEIPVAGGEQDASLPRFRWMVKNRVVDIVQPDVNYNGGFIRTVQVARMAAAAGRAITPHSPAAGFRAVTMLQFAAATPNIGAHMEFRGAPHRKETWCSPAVEIKAGKVRVPDGPGLGLEIDPAYLAKAEKV
jgi:L-alanine-DL-glutamate epimerase-like enolase superfamily enzyme